MEAEPLQHPGNLSAGFPMEELAKHFIGKSVEIEFPSRNRFQEAPILPVKEIESSVRSFSLSDRSGHFVQISGVGSRIFQSANKLQIAAVGRSQQFYQNR